MSKETTLSVLAFAPHPDDAEIFCGGTLAKLAQTHSVGIVDLTAGELGSQGTPEDRAREAAQANTILGLQHREQLGLPDGGIQASSQEQVVAVVTAIRRFQPELILAPWTRGRHPDHQAAGELLVRACYFAGVKKFAPQAGAAHTTTQVAHYRLRQEFHPSFVCDISETQEKKMQAVACYQSQVTRAADATESTSSKPGPLISSPLSVRTIESVDRYYGAMIGVAYGEAFFCRSPLAVPDPLSFFREHPTTSALTFPGE